LKSIRRIIGGLLIGGGLMALSNFVHGQETATPDESLQAITDLDVMIQALESTTPLPATAAPNAGNFYSAQHAPNTEEPWPPLPADVLGLAVFVRPSTANARPESFAAFAVADMIGDVSRCFGSGLVVGGISHGKSPFLSFGLRQSRPDGTKKKSLSAGAKRTGQI
jgi:hypothetical protein